MAPQTSKAILPDDKKFPSLLPANSDESPVVIQWIDSVYNSMHLYSYGLDKKVFFLASKGYEYLKDQNMLDKPGLLTICDYTKSSKQKRLYVLDMVNGKVLYHSYVSHGKNSGAEFATSFSNKAESHKSSLGFMVTGDTYMGKSGYSLHLDGKEKGFNDRVRDRAVVMHGSRYVSSTRASEGDEMGRSFGCPAVPYNTHKDIINTIKGGSCFFIYAEDKLYKSTSKIINARFSWPVNAPNILNDTVQQFQHQNIVSSATSAQIVSGDALRAYKVK